MTVQPEQQSFTAAEAAALQQIEQQRQDQLALAIAAVAAFGALWPLFQRGLATGSLAPWFEAIAVVGQEYAAAAWFASRQRYEGDRLQAGVPGRAPDFRPIDLDVEALWGSMRALYNEAKERVRVGKAERLDDSTAELQMAQAFQKHVLAPGRALVHEAVDEGAALRADEPVDPARVDRMLVGYMRVTDGDPCDFCAMLAARGAVYATPDSALLREDGERYHDGCSCLARAVWTTDPVLPAMNREMAALWREAQENPPPGERLDQQGPRDEDGLPDVAGRRARNNFRRALAARRREFGLPRR